ncbi:MAG: wax ester/triacylglycerol synthase family O-acyltransferase [Bryobacteraceae bacterium]
MSGIDAAFLYLERKEIPLNIACVAVFDGPIPFREFVANIDSKLDLIPRYRQLAVPPPFNLGYPTWEYDPNFHIRHHIFRVRLDAPGGEAELEALAGRLLSQVLDRGKPLWEVHIVEGLKDGRGALIARIHHALADGVAGAALLRIMLDPTPEGSHAIRKPRTRRAAPPRAEHTLAEQVGGAIQSALENVVAAEAGLLGLAEGLLSDRGKNALQSLAALLPELLKPPERFPFNKPCSGDRKFCWAEVDFSEVQAIRAALGGKVNDCILSVVVRAIARYIRLHGEKVKGRFLRVVCPVNLRGDEQGESLGNRITFLPVVLPLDVRNPVEMLHAVATRMEIMKSVRAAELIAIAASCLGAAPAPMQELFWRGIPLVPLPLPLLNVICTNVAGSPSALYTVGRRLVASYPAVPTGYELGVGVAVQSYDGKLFFGLTADAHVAPDIARLRDYIRVCFEELSKAARVKSAPPRATTPRAARPRPAKRTKPAKPAQPVEPSASDQGRAREQTVFQPAEASPEEPVRGEIPPTNGHAADQSHAREQAVRGEIPLPDGHASDPSRDRQGAVSQPQPVSV